MTNNKQRTNYQKYQKSKYKHFDMTIDNYNYLKQFSEDGKFKNMNDALAYLCWRYRK